jgi:hypothetical protein
MFKNILTATVFLFIAGCGSIYQPDAVSPGYEKDEMKLSPCACIQVEKAALKPASSVWVIFG